MKRLNTSLLARFRKSEEANLSVEAMILLPVLLWAFAAMFVFFDNFRSHSIAQKAAYTIGDMMSRETDYITPEYMYGAYKLLHLLSDANRHETAIRITVIKYNADQDKYQRVWSRQRGDGFTEMTNTDVKNLAPKLPNMVHNEQVILTETKARYIGSDLLGLLDKEITTFVYTRPRFAPQVLWTPTGGA